MSESEPTVIAAAFKALDFEASLRTVQDKQLTVRYRVTNRNQVPVLLLNRGDTESGLTAKVVYVEPQPDGVVEIAQRGFLQPTEGLGTDRGQPLLPGFSRLAPGESTEVEVSVPLPLQRRSPFMKWDPPTATMPKSVKQVKFCLGVLEDSADLLTYKQKGVEVMSQPMRLKQQYRLCSPVYDLDKLSG